AADDLLLGRLADRAGVDDDEVGRLHRCGFSAAGPEQPAGHLLRIAAVHLAAQRPDEEARQRLVLGPELLEARVRRYRGVARDRSRRAAGRGRGRDVEDGQYAVHGRAVDSSIARVRPGATSGGTQSPACAWAYVSRSLW